MRDELVLANGVLIHSCSDWPCRLCRPFAWAGLGPNFLCVECAVSITAAAIPAIGQSLRGEAALQGVFDDECPEAEEAGVTSAWDLLGLRPPKRG